MDEELARVAARQEGLLTTADLARAGVDRNRRRRMMSAGWLWKAAPGVFAVAGVPDSHRFRLRLGCRLIDRLLDDAGGHSMLERRFLELVRDGGLPRPRTQVVHRRNGRHVARVDFLFDVGVVVEVSGGLGHSSPSDRARDAQRRNELQEIGRKVYEYTWRDITEQPGMVQRTLTRRLRDAGLHP